MASTSVLCADCGTSIEALPGVSHNVMYLSWSHPTLGGGGVSYCMENGCANDVLTTLLGKLPEPKTTRRG